jgi:hypothetical protein
MPAIVLSHSVESHVAQLAERLVTQCPDLVDVTEADPTASRNLLAALSERWDPTGALTPVERQLLTMQEAAYLVGVTVGR